MTAPDLATDVSGNPYVEVFFDPADFDVDVAYLQVWRYSEGREWKVRGGVNIATGVAALDFEAPFNVQSEYRAEMFTASGASLGWTEAAAIVLSYDGMIVHQPLDPTLWVSVSNLERSARSLTRPTPGEVVFTEGGSVGIRIGARRQGLAGAVVQFFTDTLAEADTFQAILGPYGAPQIPVVCIRSSGSVRWPRTFFASGEWAEVDFNVRYDGEGIVFEASCDEVAPPFPGLAVPLLTYDDLDVAYVSYDVRDSSYASYTDMDRDYSLAGLAG